MQVKQEIDGDEGIFYLEQHGKRLGEMRYTIMPDKQMDIYHTEVDPELQGQHMGEKLVEAGVNYARENDIKISPSCSFARVTFARNKQYQDVLA
ncbi:N-acetyltransferase [Mucilaginibacter sp. Bleaf8]|uniref:GNAT family N-acetyltransferase n=1 Tax=Mucilaginibacter sp. Bleaf8 TaxID=2834430 RepID=UPI001BCE8D48|nr:GNAT family N-acetyltransferase [Mucilaginibacter sp. Bleaf8]MBS7563294.1 N-acetyltransferase [Mucilaginibacter sp. Bleaf8]